MLYSYSKIAKNRPSNTGYTPLPVTRN